MEEKKMAKFNKRVSVEQEAEQHKDTTINKEGGIAFKLDSLTRLYERVSACLVSEPKFYKNIVDNEATTQIVVGGKTIQTIKSIKVENNEDSEILKDIREVAKIDPEFILKLAIHCRNELYLRSISILLLVEAANIVECKPFVRRYSKHIIKRADELREALAYQMSRFGEPLPNSLKKGLADAFESFDEYQFEKYSGGSGKIKFSNVLRMVHPKPKDEARKALYNYLIYPEGHPKSIKNRLKYLPILKAKEELMSCKELDKNAEKLAKEAHATWEVFVSKFGSTEATWKYIAPTLPVMALIRNLRNLLDKKVPVNEFLGKLQDKETILNSKQLPFRWFSAYKEIEGNSNPSTGKVLDALQDAMEISVQNVPRLGGITFSTADNSGSMQSPLSQRSKVMYCDVANIMQAILAHVSDDVVTSVFAEHFKVVNVSKRDGIITNMKKFKDTDVGYSTDAYKALMHLNENKIKVDRIVIFSDMQCYDSGNRYSGTAERSLVAEFKKYKRNVNPNVRLFSINLAGYGSAQFPQDDPNVALIAGWSDRVFDFIKLFESDKKQAVDRVRMMTLPERKLVDKIVASNVKVIESNKKIKKVIYKAKKLETISNKTKSKKR